MKYGNGSRDSDLQLAYSVVCKIVDFCDQQRTDDVFKVEFYIHLETPFSVLGGNRYDESICQLLVMSHFHFI